MKKFTKLTCMALALAMSLSLLAGCGLAPNTDITGGSSSAPTANSTSLPAPAPAKEAGLYIDGAKADIGTVLTIDGVEIGFDEYRYYFMNILRQAQSGGAVDAKEIKDAVVSSLRTNVALVKMVEENKITLTDEEKAAVDKRLTEQKESFPSEEEYKAAISSAYFTEDILKKLAMDGETVTKLTATLFKDDIAENVAKNYVHAKHILIPFPEQAAADGAASTSAPKKDHSKELASANEVMDKIKAGESFEELMKTYSQDPGQPEEGYYFTTGKMVKEFETAAFALKEGEVSDIVETSYGYHIIKKSPFEEKEMMKDPMTYMSEESYQKWIEEISKKGEAYDVKYCDLYEKITPDTMA
ncbi:MAG: peptidylprolyl isomerase [Oscillospiraceae bacterium]